MHIARHRITLLMAAVVVLIGVMHLAAPVLVRTYALHWLKDHGASHAKIDRVRVNPWLGRLTVEGLATGDGLSVGQAVIDIDWWPLWHHRIDLRALHLEHTRLRLVQQADGSWAPAGLRLSPSAPSGHPWRLILHGIDLSRVRIALAGKGLQASVPIEQMSLALVSMSPSGAQILNASLQLGRSHVAVGDYRAADAALSLQGQLALPANIDEVPGARHLAVRIQGLHLAAGKASLDIGRILVHGIRATGPKDVQVAGIELRALTAADLPGGISAHADAVDAAPVSVQQDSLGATRVQVDGLRATAPDGLSLGAVHTATLDRLSLRHGTHVSFSRLSLQGIALPATKNDALGNIEGITAGNAEIDGGLRLGTLALRGMNLALVHRKDGLAVIDRLKALAASPPATNLHAKAASKATAGANANRGNKIPDVRIDHASIDATSRIALRDAAVNPPFVTHLTIESFKLAAFDTRGAAPSTLAAVLKFGDEGKLTLNGSFRLNGGLKAADMTLVMRRLSMPPLSGYTERDFGNAINTGQMDLDSRVHVDGDAVQARNKFTVRNLSLKAMPDAGKATQTLGMPLGMAVDMLRNDRGDITLNVPVTGRLHDPNLHLSDAFNQALTSAMRTAALSSASLLLQPYGSILPAISLASGLIGRMAKPRLTPVAFAPRASSLSRQAKAYTERIAALLKKKRDFRLQVCGVAARGDFLPGTSATPKEGTAGRNQLLSLAASRSSQVIKALVAQGIGADRLFNCRPEIDTNAPGGRVELLLR